MPSQPLQLYQGNNRTEKKVLLLFSCWTSLGGTWQGRIKMLLLFSCWTSLCGTWQGRIKMLLLFSCWTSLCETGHGRIKVLLLFSCSNSLCGTGQGRRYCYKWRHVMPQGSRWKMMLLCHPWSISSQPLCMCMWVESQTMNRWADKFLVIIMDICNAPTLQLWGCLTSITHIMYIEMENVISNLTKH